LAALDHLATCRFAPKEPRMSRERWGWVMTLFILVLLPTLTWAAGSATGGPLEATSDACAPLIPDSLRLIIAQTYPGHRPPTASDNSVADIAYERQRGGTDCLGVATGDFDGNGEADVALLLTPEAADRTLLVVARRLGASWQVDTLHAWGVGRPQERSRFYVKTVPPGQYRRTQALTGPSGPGERLIYRSKHQGIVSGVIESSSVAFFFTGKEWVHVWLSD
jgi:hypothetical protein